MGRIYLLVCFTIFFSTSILAQENDCQQSLDNAVAEFNAGRFYGVPSILKPCLDKGFTKEQKMRAYLLLVQSYLVLDDLPSAEESYLQLLRVNPEYVPNISRDPVDVYYLSKKFTSTPLFTPYFRIGANASIPHYIYNITTSSSPSQVSVDRTLKLGFSLGAGIDWNITDRWSLCTGASYTKKSFTTTLNDRNANQQTTFLEKQDWIDIPFFLKYSYDSGQIRPFFYAGAALNYLFADRITPNGVVFNSPVKGSQQSSSGSDINIIDLRNQLNRSIVFGGGFKYKIRKNFLFVDLRYLVGLSNVAKNVYGQNGQISPAVWQYQHASSYFRLDNVSLVFGFISPLYHPRKKKTIKTFLDKLDIRKIRK